MSRQNSSATHRSSRPLQGQRKSFRPLWLCSIASSSCCPLEAVQFTEYPTNRYQNKPYFEFMAVQLVPVWNGICKCSRNLFCVFDMWRYWLLVWCQKGVLLTWRPCSSDSDRDVTGNCLAVSSPSLSRLLLSQLRYVTSCSAEHTCRCNVHTYPTQHCAPST